MKPGATVLPQLLDVDHYRPETWDFRGDPAGQAYWASVYVRELEETLLPAIQALDGLPAEQRDAFAREYRAAFEALGRRDDAQPPPTFFDFNDTRQAMIDRYAIADPYQRLKADQNRLALRFLPRWLDRLDSLPRRERQVELARGLMAGNMFDVGSPAAYEQHARHEGDFVRACDALPSRPWQMDDLDAWIAAWEPAGCFANGDPSPHVAAFVDNAGSDIVLGVLPLVREMVRNGSRVTLVANSGPALNDITVNELRDLLAQAWPMLAMSTPPPAVVGSGTASPYLDLRRLGPECVAAVADANCIWLHGMGRSLETNFAARFGCAALRTAVFKDELLAGRAGAALFDCAFRFSPGPAAARS